jgi:hypothetical protein
VEAETLLTKGINLAAFMVAEFPGVPGFRQLRARGLFHRGLFYESMRRWADAEASYMQGLANQTTLAVDYPGHTSYRDEHTDMAAQVVRFLESQRREALARLAANTVATARQPLLAATACSAAQLRVRHWETALHMAGHYRTMVK